MQLSSGAEEKADIDAFSFSLSRRCVAFRSALFEQVSHIFAMKNKQNVMGKHYQETTTKRAPKDGTNFSICSLDYGTCRFIFFVSTKFNNQYKVKKSKQYNTFHFNANF